ncbi:hypothetical protein LSCM4_01427 [Leishmania orientalis]|uniref:HECT-type E3 ubiquitin transferase n=1 Tax=Leishmania orientalis TaxID=2249476 RepID=A0A836KAE2_9TRYP|nr:hypothetical protein LSCM4_01427 [Leishmania orientalis]
MDVGAYDPKAQVKAVAAALKAMSPTQLFEAVEAMSTSLVMGLEGYLRKFDSGAAIPLLADVCETFISENSQGDLLVIALRALSLIMEHVPSSYEAAQGFHVSLMQLSSQAIHRALCMEWNFVQSDNASVIEEGLRVMRFISKDDMSGELIHHALVGDLLTLCTDPHPLVARQALETLLMMCSKVVMPSELEKPSHSFAAGILAFFKSKKKSLGTRGEVSKAGRMSSCSGGSLAKTAAAEDIVPYADHPTVVQVENVIAPLLVTLIEQYSKSLVSIPERWALLELLLQCLGTLIERALICHRPHTARALASPLLPRILFQLIVDTESNVTLEPGVRVDRVLLCETTLGLLTNCHRYLMLESLQLPEAHRFFQLILGDSTEEITTLLDDPFPRAVIATRSTQRRDKDHITSIAALQLFVLACPTVPPDAFGLKPKLVLPVHQWMWEDELRHNNRLIEEQCLSLEKSWARLDHHARIFVHLKQLNVDLRTMTMTKCSGGGHRNICRGYVPFVYHFADEVTLRPVVAVKEAGPCAADGTMLVWKPLPPATRNSDATARATIAKEVDDHSRDTGSASRSRRKTACTAHAFSEDEDANAPASASPSVVLNTQVKVPESHVSLAEEYFSSLCLFAKNTSGQMAKQVATCACASMLQLVLLSGASKRFEELMRKAVLPMCEMYREALISADKATKAVVLTMIEWMLYHPMAEPCEFTESAVRCGLLAQLDILSKTTLLVHDRPTRTATLVEKSRALAGCIVEKVKERRSVSADRSFASASPATNTPLGGVFLSTTMAHVQAVLNELRGCKCGGTKDTVAAASSSKTTATAIDNNRSTTRESEAHADTRESEIRELLRIFDESSDITAYEVFNVELASTLLYYLLGDRTLEDIMKVTGVDDASAPASSLTREAAAPPDGQTGPIERTASSWEAMIASGLHVADILAMYVVEERMRCFIQCAVAYPTGMQRLVYTLTANLSLQSYLPLVESVVTYDKVVCKTPLQAHHALSIISPLVALCGDAGRRISAALKTSADDDAVALPCMDSSVTASGTVTTVAGTPTIRAESRPCKASVPARAPACSGNGLPEVSDPANVARVAKECCMAGHALHYIERYPQARRCDKCNRNILSGHNCRTCSYDVCEECYPLYTGNVELIRSLAAKERNRVHLCATVGDLERWFRTGSTSTKGTELAPTSQSSLHHLERFTTRVLTFLKRYTGDFDASAVSPTAHISGATASNPLSASPAASTNLSVELAKRLLSHPDVVRRLTYKYLSQFSTRGALMDESTPVTSELAASLDAEVQKVLSTAAERQVAEDVVQEAVEERYILYRPSCGMLPSQETVLSTLYRRAFALGDQQVLLQLENCLLRVDGAAEEQLTLKAKSSVTVTNPAVLSSRRDASVRGTKKAKSVESACAVTNGIPAGASAANASGKLLTSSVEMSTEAKEFDGHRVTLDQTYLFHHFESDAAAYCACGEHSRAEFHTEEPPALTFTAPDFAHRADMLLLIMFHRVLFEETHGLIAYATEARNIFGGDDSVFENNTITTTLVRSLEASALRVSMLPPRYALPRWVNFILREGRFLIPLSVRERASRFLAYGARRAFTQHMRAFRAQRNDRALLILPGEWAKLSNHKFSVSRDTFARDAYTMLRKCSEARFPISVEFKGDVGVGQGPTAQFYTLLAAEASTRCANLWRVSDDKGNESSNSVAPVPFSSLAGMATAGPSTAARPRTSLPPRRSCFTPTVCPARTGTPRHSSANNRVGRRGSSPSFGSASTTSSSRTLGRSGSAGSVSPGAALSGNLSMTAAPDADTVLVAPPEGFYPRHMEGVRHYSEDAESFPTTSPQRRNRNRTLRDNGVARASSQNSSRPIGSSATRKDPFLALHVAAAGTGGKCRRSKSPSARTAQYDPRKAACLVDSNVGLMRDYVLEQRERAKAYYAIGAALGRAFVDEQVFPLPLSRAVAYFIRRGLPAYQCVLSDVTHIDPPPEFPIDLFELPLTAARWVDQGIAQSLASLSTMDSGTLASLDLHFTLPGDDNFELLPGGARLKVTKKNLRLYQRRVVGALLYESVAVPLYFLTMGCRDVVPPEALTVMEVKELIGVLCGENKNPNDPLWTTDEIRSVLVGDHGYQNDSPQLELLAKVLGERLTPAEQRDFLLFCTGCPRLPIGGIRALGAITVVKRSNAFDEAGARALRAGAAKATVSSSGGAGTLGMEEEEDEGGLLSGTYEQTALSDVEDTPSGRHETPPRSLSLTYPSASEELGGMASTLLLELPESEWALPSVNTCFRYLKLPPYPSEELLYKKLMMSITQSGGSFELS